MAELNLFGNTSTNLNTTPSPVSNNKGNNNMNAINSINASSSPMVTNKDNNMTTAQFAFDNARTYSKTVQIPSVDLTEEQIAALSPRTYFEMLLNTGKVAITRAANESRKVGVPVMFRNKIQADQLGRALALAEHNIHTAWQVQIDAEQTMITLMDNKGENDRAAIGRLNANDGKVYYSAHYARKTFNDFGQLIGVSSGDVHPIGMNILNRVGGYNSWVDFRNAEVMAKAKSGDTEGVDANRFVQFNTVTHINADSIINKYMLEAWILLNVNKPAFEIYSRAKSGETMSAFIDGMVAGMERSYRNELRKLAGLVIYSEAAETENV